MTFIPAATSQEKTATADPIQHARVNSQCDIVPGLIAGLPETQFDLAPSAKASVKVQPHRISLQPGPEASWQTVGDREAEQYAVLR